jgi:DNA-directed RNA polymerase specialized sigma24 family protein
MTREGLPSIIERVQDIARAAIRQRFPGMASCDLDDLSQQTLLTIAARIHTFDRSRPATPSIQRVALNVGNDWYRQEKRGAHALASMMRRQKETTIWGRYFIMRPKALQKAIEAIEQKASAADD